MADVYAVDSRYLAAPGPFEEYLRLRDEVAAEARRQIEEFQGPQGNLRAILLARRPSWFASYQKEISLAGSGSPPCRRQSF